MSPSVAPGRRSGSIDGRDDEQRVSQPILSSLPGNTAVMAIARSPSSCRQAGWTINDKLVERIWQREGLCASAAGSGWPTVRAFAAAGVAQ